MIASRKKLKISRGIQLSGPNVLANEQLWYNYTDISHAHRLDYDAELFTFPGAREALIILYFVLRFIDARV